jgi:hypothetical protein
MQNTPPVAESARAKMAAALVSLTAKERGERLLGFADFAEMQNAMIDAQRAGIEARDGVISTLFKQLKAVGSLMHSGRSGSAKRLLAGIVATEIEPFPPTATPQIPDELFGGAM